MSRSRFEKAKIHANLKADPQAIVDEDVASDGEHLKMKKQADEFLDEKEEEEDEEEESEESDSVVVEDDQLTKPQS